MNEDMRFMRLRVFIFNNLITHIPSCRLKAWYLRVSYKWRIGKNNRLWNGITLDGDTYGRVSIGDNCELARGSYFNTSPPARIIIGNNVVFGHDVSLYGVDHDPDDPHFRMRVGDIVIEDNCWIASKVSILRSVTIAQGSAIGFGSVVTRSVPRNVIAAGVPAKVIRPRLAHTGNAERT